MCWHGIGLPPPQKPTPADHFPATNQRHFRVITMDQRNATGGESTGPVLVDDPWGAFADDQLGLMDHLGIRQFFFFGNCIGPFAMKLMERAQQRVVSRDFAKSCQTPMLVLPDDVTAHPLQVSIDIASLAPNAEITVFPWKDPPELKARTINRA
jgi:pimeloyl-ACP methyl ester carboxylesterase